MAARKRTKQNVFLPSSRTPFYWSVIAKSSMPVPLCHRYALSVGSYLLPSPTFLCRHKVDYASISHKCASKNKPCAKQNKSNRRSTNKGGQLLHTLGKSFHCQDSVYSAVRSEGQPLYLSPTHVRTHNRGLRKPFQTPSLKGLIYMRVLTHVHQKCH